MSILEKRVEYNFPYSLLSDETGGSLQSLHLVSCAFHPRTALGCHKNLYPSYVHITGEELEHFVSSCSSLVQLLISRCNDIVCFRGYQAYVLRHLNHFHVTECQKLGVIEINAPKLSNFVCLGAEVKHITMMGMFGDLVRLTCLFTLTRCHSASSTYS
ncbi:hypothetical protein SETIT_8G136100v2 [Setaria italica]|uniref:At1g61320/AtMIF1 LRR domain-containing protein n=1 Tax=Setaria italica TaxID=4555 RepID=A0A368S7P6_SETIT|nr:hypothetical protein SETIT_8G136100v2 [Setaria italica]